MSKPLKNQNLEKTTAISVKCVLIGNSGVGKSSILIRFADDSFTDSYISTVGVDFRIKDILLDEKKVRMNVFDTAGQERFQAITSAYYRGSDAIVIVFDVTDPESFSKVDDFWMNEVQKYAHVATKVVLVGNKADCEEKRQVSRKTSQLLADAHKIPYFEVSAQRGTNIDEIFLHIAKEVSNSKTNVSKSIDLSDVKVAKNSCC
jgi:Ras-related protein Rab-1A